MKIDEAIYCLHAESECCEEICDECPLYGQVGEDHCYEEALHMATDALKFQKEYGSDLMLLDEFIENRGKELIQLRKEMDKTYQDKVQKCIDKITNGGDYFPGATIDIEDAVYIINEELAINVL